MASIFDIPEGQPAAGRLRDQANTYFSNMNLAAIRSQLDGLNLHSMSQEELINFIVAMNLYFMGMVDANHNVADAPDVATLSARNEAALKAAVVGRNVYELTLLELKALIHLWLIGAEFTNAGVDGSGDITDPEA